MSLKIKQWWKISQPVNSSEASDKLSKWMRLFIWRRIISGKLLSLVLVSFCLLSLIPGLNSLPNFLTFAFYFRSKELPSWRSWACFLFRQFVWLWIIFSRSTFLWLHKRILSWLTFINEPLHSHLACKGDCTGWACIYDNGHV